MVTFFKGKSRLIDKVDTWSMARETLRRTETKDKHMLTRQ